MLRFTHITEHDNTKQNHGTQRTQDTVQNHSHQRSHFRNGTGVQDHHEHLVSTKARNVESGVIPEQGSIGKDINKKAQMSHTGSKTMFQQVRDPLEANRMSYQKFVYNLPMLRKS